ncbi:hypothetical protein PAXINDRAFT_14598 [Paxillus involutus ATCC 200175]|uniref:Uncharacterized protein n=1 Tax=Paxillus involutus ATCC 200175 TaxID=664439 RepID=A0A0C9TA53_PAXIN|nr:hypothetical protein PAXINDRAFT_14598 [Paxillus involutus ATCC 200175]
MYQVAEENVKNAGVSNVRVIVGDAVTTIKSLRHGDSFEPFDLAFIDADKENNLNHFREAKSLLRQCGVIVDNVTDLSVEGVRNLLEALKEDRETDATNIATVGEKGYDGLICAVKLWIRQFDHKYTCIVYQLLL